MCQVPESEAVKLWSAATCVAACFPGGAGGGGRFSKLYVWGSDLKFGGGCCTYLPVGHGPP